MQPIIFSSYNATFRQNALSNYLLKLGIKLENNPDVIFLRRSEEKKNIGVAEVRSIIKESSSRPVLQDIKVIIIEDAQFLSTEAQNALLKSLEESPEFILYILCVDHPDNLLPTVRSRAVLHSAGAVEMEHDFDDSFYLKRLMELSLGERVDWVLENKSDLSDRDLVSNLFDFWLTESHDLLLSGEIKDKQFLSATVSRMITLKRNLYSNNIGALLTIESFLYSLGQTKNK